jgi:hypothetical protein
MPRNRMYAIAVLFTVAAVAGPALASVHASAAKHRTTTKVGPRGPRGARGPRGLQGSAGPTGPAGAAGAPGAPATTGTFLRTVVVSPSGGNASADGALLLSAVAGIGNPAPGTGYLVWIEPGTYDLGTTPLVIPSRVDVQGSGQDATTIASEGSLTLHTAAGTEIRDLTVTDVNTAGSAEAIDTAGGLRDVTATATGTSAATGVLANDPSMPLVDVTASGTTSASSSSARGVDTQDSARIDGGSFSAFDGAPSSQAAALFAESATLMTAATLQASGGSDAYPVDVVGTSATVRIESSTLTGSGGFFVAPGDTLDVGGSQISGVVASVSGTANCPDDWLADYSTASTDCS